MTAPQDRTAPDVDLAAIEARANAATEGPWDLVPLNPGWVQAPPVKGFERIVCRGGLPGNNDEANGEFIAHARTDVPALIAEVRRLAAAGMATVAEAERIAAERNRLAAVVALALRDHYLTRDVFGGEMRDVCGRCRHGDGAPMLWPCPTRQALESQR